MSGSATLTIVTSSSSMNVATHTAPSVHQRWGSGAEGPWSLIGVQSTTRRGRPQPRRRALAELEDAVDQGAGTGAQAPAQHVGALALEVGDERSVLLGQARERVMGAHEQQE